MKKLAIHLAAVAALALGASGAQAGLVNGGFESLLVPIPASNFIITDQANVTGWKTTEADGKIEVWKAPGADFAFDPINAPTPSFNGLGSGAGANPLTAGATGGTNYAELNANSPAALYQEISGISSGALVGWQLAHRGRTGTDTMRLTITDLGLDGVLGGAGVNADTTLFQRTFSDSNNAWGFYQGTGITALGNKVRFSFESIATSNSDLSYGNLLDAVDFGIGVGVPEPASLALVGLALAGAGLARRRTQKAA